MSAPGRCRADGSCNRSCRVTVRRPRLPSQRLEPADAAAADAGDRFPVSRAGLRAVFASAPASDRACQRPRVDDFAVFTLMAGRQARLHNLRAVEFLLGRDWLRFRERDAQRLRAHVRRPFPRRAHSRAAHEKRMGKRGDGDGGQDAPCSRAVRGALRKRGRGAARGHAALTRAQRVMLTAAAAINARLSRDGLPPRRSWIAPLSARRRVQLRAFPPGRTRRLAARSPGKRPACRGCRSAAQAPRCSRAACRSRVYLTARSP